MTDRTSIRNQFEWILNELNTKICIKIFLNIPKNQEKCIEII